MKEWFYSKGEQQLGPVNEDKLRELIQQGTINPRADLVWSEGMPEWISPASAGLLSSGVSSENPYAAPTVAPQLAPNGSLPYIKPTSFGLIAALMILGGIVAVIGYIIMEESDEILGIIAILAGLTALLAGGIISLIYLYRGWTVLQPHTSHSTPGKAVGFLFIPFFSLYWYFVAYWRFSQEWNRIVAGNPTQRGAPSMSEGLILTYAILNIISALFTPLAIVNLIIFLIIMKQICDGVNYAANQSRPA